MEIYFENWHDKFVNELLTTKKLRIISPFLDKNILFEIGKIFDFKNFELITRFKIKDFAEKVSSLEAIIFSFNKGASIYGIQGLHSKVYLFDKKAAIITSANLTKRGLRNNLECGIYTNDNIIIGTLHNYFNKLRSVGTNLSNELYEKMKKDLTKIKNPKSQSSTTYHDYGASLIQFDKNKNYYIKIFGKSENRKLIDFSIKDEVNESLCHYACCFPKNKKPRQIKNGDIIYMARITENPNDYAIFGKAIAMKFVDGRDEASEDEIKERPWKREYPNYIRVKDSIFINGQMQDCTFLKEIINKLNYGFFELTKIRFDKGDSNFKINNYLKRISYIKITPDAAELIEQKFQESIKLNGKIDDHFINQLPNSKIKVTDYDFNKSVIGKEGKQYIKFQKIVEEIKERVADISEKEFPNVPTYIAIDHFWHWIIKVWQKQNRPIPSLTNRSNDILILFKEFCNWDKTHDNYTIKMSIASKDIFSKLLSKRHIQELTSDEAKLIYSKLHSGAMRTKRFGSNDNFIQKNSINKIITSLTYLLYSNDEIELRIQNLCDNPKYKLYEFSSSASQEIIGWVKPNKFPLCNSKAIKAIKLLGFNIN